MSRNNLEYPIQGCRVYLDDPITSRAHHADYHILSSHHPTLDLMDQFMLILFNIRQHRNNNLDIRLNVVDRRAA